MTSGYVITPFIFRIITDRRSFRSRSRSWCGEGKHEPRAASRETKTDASERLCLQPIWFCLPSNSRGHSVTSEVGLCIHFGLN